MVEIGRIRVVDVESGAQAPPEGSIVYARDTDKAFLSDGSTLTEISSGGGGLDAEGAQDAVGSMVDATLTYVDATPSLGVATNGIGNTHIRDSAALSVIGRSANSSGDPADIAGATVGHVLQVLSGPTIGFGANGVRRPSWDNPPASPHAYDDEFDTGTLDAKWTIASAGTTNPATSGTINYTSSLTTPIVDVATVPSWAMFQCDNSTLQSFGIYQSVTLDTNATLFCRFGAQNRDPSGVNEGDFVVKLYNSGDTNEWVLFGVTRNTTDGSSFMQVNNNGATTNIFQSTRGNDTNSGSMYVVVWKISNAYHMASGLSNGLFTYSGSISKTGVTTLDRLSIGFNTTANETPSIIDGVDFFRYKASLDYSLVNP